MCSYGLNYTVYTSPWPFFDFITVTIVNQYLSQWFPIQSPHTSAVILFYDIMKSEENVISNIKKIFTAIKLKYCRVEIQLEFCCLQVFSLWRENKECIKSNSMKMKR